jgi:hypothetical protein
MSNNLILRTSPSPYGDTTKGSVLSQSELDSNFITLKGEVIYSADTVGDLIILKKYNGNDISFSAGSGVGSVTYTNPTPTPIAVGGVLAGSTFNAKTMQEMWDLLLYPYQPPAFSFFGLSGIANQQEIGYDITPSQTFTWATTNSANVAINSVQLAGYNLTTLTGLANDGSEAVTFTSPITRNAIDGVGTRAWTIQAQNTSGNTFSTSSSIRWDWRMYVGTSLLTTLNESQIEGLTDFNSVKNGYAGTFNMSAGGYKYFCFADTYGTPTSFKDTSNNLNIGMNTSYTNTDSNGNTYQLVSVTNTNGETTNYRVYRTLNILASTINIQIA